MAIIDATKPNRPFEYRWRLDFTADAKPQPVELWRTQAQAAKTANDAMVRGLAGQPLVRH